MKWPSFILFFVFTSAYAKLSTPKAFKAHFTKIYKSKLSGKERKSSGIIEYAYPGMIKLEFSSPDKITFISDSKETWFYRAPLIAGEPGQLTKGRTSDLPLLKVFDLLKGGLKENKYYSIENKKGSYLLRVKENQKKYLKLDLLELIFNEKKEVNFDNLKEISLVKNDGQKVSFYLEKLIEVKSFPLSNFKFTSPPNTRITN